MKLYRPALWTACNVALVDLQHYHVVLARLVHGVRVVSTETSCRELLSLRLLSSSAPGGVLQRLKSNMMLVQAAASSSRFMYTLWHT